VGRLRLQTMSQKTLHFEYFLTKPRCFCDYKSKSKPRKKVGRLATTTKDETEKRYMFSLQYFFFGKCHFFGPFFDHSRRPTVQFLEIWRSGNSFKLGPIHSCEGVNDVSYGNTFYKLIKLFVFSTDE